MCGLIGFFGSKKSSRYALTDRRSFMYDGLYMSALRGEDATGMAMMREGKKSPLVYKRALPSYDYLRTKIADKIISNLDEAFGVLGHTRAATKGYVSDENAHPFQYGPITLTHNGHVSNYRQLNAKCDSAVDSAHVAAALAENEAVEVLGELYGEFAFVWHDLRDGSINFARNAGRPLYWATVGGWEAVAYASELEMLGALMTRNNMKLIGNQFTYPSPHMLYKFFPETFEIGKEAKYDVLPFAEASRKKAPATGARTAAGAASTTSRVTKKQLEEAVSTVSRYKAVHFNNSGRPSGKKGITKAEKSLSALGLKYERIWGSKVLEFVKYKNQEKLGSILVEVLGPQLKTNLGEIHNVKEEVYDIVKNYNVVMIIPVNTRLRKGGKVSVIAEFDPNFFEKAMEAHGNFNSAALSYPGPHNSLISAGRFRELTKDGCCICAGDIELKDAPEVLWTNGTPSDPCCAACASNPTTRNEFDGFINFPVGP
jgi:predicted glutamine amidotransferase